MAPPECIITGEACIHGCINEPLCDSEASRLTEIFFKHLLASLREKNEDSSDNIAIEALYNSAALLGLSPDETRRLEIIALSRIPDLIAQSAQSLSERLNNDIPPDDHITPTEITRYAKDAFDPFQDL